MSTLLKYMPIFRVRPQETKVLKSFDFGERIYPCLEIVKELDRVNSKKKKDPQISLFGSKKEKSFEDVYIPIIKSIKANKVFIDLPVHLPQSRNTKPPTLLFLRTVVTNREKRTEYLKRLKPVASKIIPVISSYLQVNGEGDSISLQEKEIRNDFKTLAFRTFIETFHQDIQQIKKSVKPNDYIIMDFENNELDETDGDIQDIVEDFKNLNCNIVIHHNQIPEDITMTGLNHGNMIDTIDNSLPYIFKQFAGHCFSDYVGIKKDNITSGGVISPGFLFYDAVTNNFFGFRYKNGGHKKGETKPDLIEFETTIVPAVIASKSTERMQSDSLDFLGVGNKGWEIISNIQLGENNGGESGKSPAKFKRISMEHYLHCIKLKISNGDFD
ncbi:MAG: hypothetical protein PSN34_05680 [Urechidicola sp.]|nr:hypothetical protein [Urechidicola sp.]